MTQPLTFYCSLDKEYFCASCHPVHIKHYDGNVYRVRDVEEAVAVQAEMYEKELDREIEKLQALKEGLWRMRTR